MRVAITGATGFLGGYVIEAVNAAGHEAVALGRGGQSLAAREEVCAAVRETDYGLDSLCGALAGCDAVVHLAGRRMTRADDPFGLEPFVDPNVLLVDRLVTACSRAGTGRIVFASTIAVYSAADPAPYREEIASRPINAYGWSKLCAEQVLNMRAAPAGLSAVSLRVAAAYGHGERDSAVLMRFAGLAARGQTLTLRGNVRTGIDYLYARDIAAAMLAGACAPRGGVYNVGSGRTASVAEMAETVNAVYGNEGNCRVEDPREGPVSEARMDISRAARDLGWTPAWDLRAGLADMRRRAEAAGTGPGPDKEASRP